MDDTQIRDTPPVSVLSTDAVEHWTDGTDGEHAEGPRMPEGIEYCGVEFEPIHGLDD